MPKRGDHKAKPKGVEPAPLKPDYSWCERIFESLDYSDSLPVDSIFALTDETPEWVHKVLKEILQQCMPSFQFSQVKEISPRALGVYIGQTCANVYQLKHNLVTLKIDQCKAVESCLHALLDNQPVTVMGVSSLEAMLLALDGVAAPFEDLVSKFEHTMHASFKAALDQGEWGDQRDYGQSVAFFQGFALGMAKPGIVKGRLARNTTATPIYSRMLVHWREIEQLPNYPALRCFLITQGVAESVVGSVRRLEKLCERMGLHLAKRGRPSKAK